MAVTFDRSSAAPLRLDVVSDSICPWCYVGKRHLEQALTVLRDEELDFALHWRPFQLNPDMPKAGVERRSYRLAKFGSWERSQALDAQVAAAGSAVGLTFRHDLMERTPNTVASHILVRLAHEAGGASLQDRVVEALFQAYFAEGRDIGDEEVLLHVAAGAGLQRDPVRSRLRDPAAAGTVIQDEQLARGLRLNGVPSVVFDGHPLFAGAQPVEGILRVLRQVGAAVRSMKTTEPAPAEA